MAQYRTVDCRIWGDQRFLGLPDASKLAWLYLLTHPNQTAVGAFMATLPGLSAELGWPTAEPFHAVLAAGMALHDPAARMFLLPRFIHYNQPQNVNQVKGWARPLSLLPECGLKLRLLGTLRSWLAEHGKDGMLEAFHAAFPQDPAEDAAMQEHYRNPSGTVPPTVSKSGTGTGTGTGTGIPPLPPPVGGFVSGPTGKRKRTAPARPYSQEFLAFWDAIPANPRKVNQDGAWRIWKAKGLDQEADRLVTWARGMGQCHQWVVDQNIPLVTTMLNQDRWKAPLPREVQAAAPPQRTPEQEADAWRMARLGFLLADLTRAVLKKHGLDLKREGQGAMACLLVLEAARKNGQDFKPGHHPDALIQAAMEAWERGRKEA